MRWPSRRQVPDLAPVAALFGDPARAAMLAALADGQALPAGELARRAGVHPATATAHLRRLVEGGLVRVRVQGRHRYHELAGPKVAAVLEALAQLAPAAPVRSLREHRSATALAEARTCYDHLAGRRGVELRDRLLAAGALHAIDERDHALTDRGQQLIADLGIDADEFGAIRRVFARCCIDWTHRRPHLAGALPAAITDCLLTLGWLSRTAGRGLRVAADYEPAPGPLAVTGACRGQDRPLTDRPAGRADGALGASAGEREWAGARCDSMWHTSDRDRARIAQNRLLPSWRRAATPPSHRLG